MVLSARYVKLLLMFFVGNQKFLVERVGIKRQRFAQVFFCVFFDVLYCSVCERQKCLSNVFVGFTAWVTCSSKRFSV
jgi:hypothetical protein